MAWTTFAALSSATGAELDTNFSTLSNLANISCLVSGTNTLALTNNNAAASISAYQANMQLGGIAAATNTGPVTAALGSLAALAVYVDTPSGPQALSGGEIVQNCQFTLVYDPTLNSGAGGFHLQTGGGSLTNQTLGVAALAINGATAVLGLPTAQYTVSFGSLTPNSVAWATVTLAGIHVGDAAIITLGTTQTAGVMVQAAIPATGSVILMAANITANTTVTPATAPYRLAVLRYS